MIIVYLQETEEDEEDQVTIERLKKAVEKAREETRKDSQDEQT